ncbi:MAG: hypothetical protein J0L62_03045 [Bacteroidetes bacterium]|nr:hypothetical protein [Bacteroidota bacterium]
MKSRKVFFAMSAALIVLQSCSTPQEVQKPAEAPRPIVGKLTPVDFSSQTKPDWLAVTPEMDDKYAYAIGIMTDVSDLGFGIQQSKMDAKTNFVSSMQSQFQAKLGQMTEGSNKKGDVARYSKIAFTQFSKLNAGGIEHKETYWVKNEKIISSNSVEYTFDIYVKMRMPKSDYESAFKKGVNDVVDQLRSEKESKLANELDQAFQEMK